MTKYTSRHSTRTYLFGLVIFVLLILTLQTKVHAVSIGEEYTSQSSFVDGTLVSIDKDNTETVVASNFNNDDYVVGVAQSKESNLVTISRNYASTTVAISGEVSILVSNVNGNIRQGEILTASWVDGVAMKMQDNSNARIIGIALEDFDSEAAKTYSDIEIPNDTPRDLQIGYIKIRISAGEAYAAQNSTLNIGGFLEELTGKDISDFRLATGFLVFISSLIVASVFIYSSIKGSFISFGRNPLASNSIYGGLLQVSTISVTVIAVGSTLAYIVWVI